MSLRILLAMIFSASIAMAEATTNSTTQPRTGARVTVTRTTQPSRSLAPFGVPAKRLAKKDATTQPTTSPSTSPTAAVKFPTPAELMAKIKKMRADEDALLKVAYFNFDRPIIEKPADFSFFGDDANLTLRSLIERLAMAREDKDVRAVLICISQPMFNHAQAQELRDALVELRRAGKKTFVHADSYDTIGYTVASGATNVCLMEGGEIMIPGVGLESLFAKGLLDKVGVKADFVQVGEYKGADEMFTRTGASDEHRGELNKIVDALYEQIIAGISLHRNLPTETVKRMIDDAMITAPMAKEQGFVDHLLNQDELRELLADELGGEVDLLADYGVEEREQIDFSNPFSFFASMMKRPEPSNKPAVALVYAEGAIVDGYGEAGLFGGGGVGSEDMRRAFRIALRDENIKAVVVRIDSPGGSALASEVMWQSARRVSEEKPVIVSIGSMAASGGYYLASAGDHIFADPSAIIGSIGVVGGKFVMSDLYEKLGLASESFTRGRNADLFSSDKSWDERQRRMVTTWMKQTYEQFTDRIMTTRKDKIGDIDKVARGRIFLAQQGKELGMVDEIGGLQSAIAHAAKEVELEPGSYDIRIVPMPRTIADLFMGTGEEATSPIRPKVTLSSDSILHLLPRDARKVLVQQVQMMQILESRPVMLMMPYVISVR